MNGRFLCALKGLLRESVLGVSIYVGTPPYRHSTSVLVCAVLAQGGAL